MELTNLLTNMATIISGIVALITLLGVFDSLSRGYIKRKVRHWLGIEQLRNDHHYTQIFLMDLGDSHNELSDVVCEEHDIDDDREPSDVRTSYYQNRLNDEQVVSRGDFTTDD